MPSENESIEQQAQMLLLAGRRLELRRSNELRKCVYERELETLRVALVQSVADVNQTVAGYYEIVWLSAWELELRDRTPIDVQILTVSSTKVGFLKFAYHFIDGKRRTELIGESYSLDVLPQGEFGWRRTTYSEPVTQNAAQVATTVLIRLLNYEVIGVNDGNRN